MHIHDLIGIGFGPSNIALAIALEEGQAPASRERPLDALFIERQPGFVWHKNMLLDHAHMQISFLKDLATLRNPSSRFTFLNYLHQKERLQDFINLKTFFPSRHEFNDYLAWAAAQFADRCVYGEEIVEVLPEPRGGEVQLLRVRSRDASGQVRERLTRHLVVGVGGMPRIPAEFRGFKEDPRVFHSSHYLQAIAGHPQARRLAIVGAGQSAAEIFMDLHGRPQRPQVDLIMRARAIKPSDDSPFVNEIFNADFTDFVFSRSGSERDDLLNEFWHTNYAAPDLALIQQIFEVFYRQRVAGAERHRFLRRHEVTGVKAVEDGVQLTLRDLNHERTTTQRYDAIVLATGYERDRHRALLAPLAPYLGDFEVDRHYRLRATPGFHPSIFLQGACELTHGLSDTLLSVTAIRSGEIRGALRGAVSLDPAGTRQESPRQAA
ncbi:lysine N(6)-hydroxylase/L-ornithine N(5)-oxygenase family protein [Roseateles amylovorans]|uniref:Lysine N(6)-hydroxylase/L-ornithine N(5)-oxygenase family protein n=1 Tax=Roseateles amylovorans TaxID=2978473 RepID=A0ABY6AY41_9BURK|nr:lysine N(6)-hydroxylase/L-ornithine N(5)-oxygenase family protein [Roseateles amylovorans]UXH76218.1 lysine N(6)-hydroxylase/L-ornithine N(5)-oxygenase family protein [Roseateles amylovorans]